MNDKEQINVSFSIWAHVLLVQGTICVLWQLSNCQVSGQGQAMGVNNFFNHLTQTSMKGFNPLSSNSGDVKPKCDIRYGNIPMQTGFIANNGNCPCQSQYNSYLGCMECRCKNHDSPPKLHQLQTPKVLGVDMPLHTPNIPYLSRTLSNVISTKPTISTSLISTKPTTSEISTTITDLSTFNRTAFVNTGDETKKTLPTTRVTTGRAISRASVHVIVGDSLNSREGFVSLSDVSSTTTLPLAQTHGWESLQMLITVLGMGAAILLLVVLSVVFFCKWRLSIKELNRQKSELYFVEKSKRQSSIVSELQLDVEKEKRMSIYSVVENVESVDDLSNTPLVPQLTPTAPPLTPGQKQQTTFRFPVDEIKHDYLELI